MYAPLIWPVGDPARPSVVALLQSLLAWLSSGFRLYLTNVHASALAATESFQVVPSAAPRVLHADPDNIRTTRRIDPNAAWHVLERSAAKALTPAEYLRANDTDMSLRVAPSNGDVWEAIECDLFMNNSSASFQGCKQFSMAFDPSAYAGEDTGVCVAYNPMSHMATVPHPSI